MSFLRRCQNPPTEALNIAKFLGFHSAQDVLPLLYRMKSEGLVKKTGYKWQLCGAGSSSNTACGSAGDPSEVFLPAAASNRPAGSNKPSGRRRSGGRLGSTGADHGRSRTASRRSSVPAEHSRTSETRGLAETSGRGRSFGQMRLTSPNGGNPVTSGQASRPVEQSCRTSTSCTGRPSPGLAESSGHARSFGQMRSTGADGESPAATSRTASRPAEQSRTNLLGSAGNRSPRQTKTFGRGQSGEQLGLADHIDGENPASSTRSSGSPRNSEVFLPASDASRSPRQTSETSGRGRAGAQSALSDDIDGENPLSSTRSSRPTRNSEVFSDASRSPRETETSGSRRAGGQSGLIDIDDQSSSTSTRFSVPAEQTRLSSDGTVSHIYIYY